jgi:hypothetical protein
MKLKYWTIILLTSAAICGSLIYYLKQPVPDLGPVTAHHVVKSIETTNSSSAPEDMSSWKIYSNADLGFSFEYPSG